MVVAHIRVQVGPRVIWLPFETFYDAHTVAKIMSDGCAYDVELYNGMVRTHVYVNGEAVSTAKLVMVN